MAGTSSNYQYDVSVILPALDEERTIADCIQKIQEVFRNNGIRGEILVADSSTDRTAEIARSLGATVVHPEKPGYGNAYLDAFRHAHGRFIVMGDADNTYDFLEIPRLLAPLHEGADLVIGSRFKGTIHEGSMAPLHRYIGNPVLTWLLNFIFGSRFSDTHSGFRAIRREALDCLGLRTGGMEFASEMLVMAAREKLRIVEVPISYHPRTSPSKLHSFADGWRHIRFILLIKPTLFIAVPGVVFSSLGIFLMAVSSLGGNIETTHLHSFILGAMLLIAGVQALLMSTIINVYSVIHGYEKKIGFISTVMSYHNLEKFLVFGGALILLGIVAGFNIVIPWIASNFGQISQISTAIISLLLITTGIQIMFFAIFISMMLLNENTLQNGHA